MCLCIVIFPIGSVNAGAIAGGVIVPIVCVALIVVLIHRPQQVYFNPFMATYVSK